MAVTLGKKKRWLFSWVRCSREFPMILLFKSMHTYLAFAAVSITFIKTFNNMHVFCLRNACRAQQDFSTKMHNESKSRMHTIRWQWWISPLHIITERKCVRQSMFIFYGWMTSGCICISVFQQHLLIFEWLFLMTQAFTCSANTLVLKATCSSLTCERKSIGPSLPLSNS